MKLLAQYFQSLPFLHVNVFLVCFQGVIRDEGDLDRLGADFKDAYSKRQIDPFDDDAWDR